MESAIDSGTLSSFSSLRGPTSFNSWAKAYCAFEGSTPIVLQVQIMGNRTCPKRLPRLGLEEGKNPRGDPLSPSSLPDRYES